MKLRRILALAVTLSMLTAGSAFAETAETAGDTAEAAAETEKEGTEGEKISELAQAYRSMILNTDFGDDVTYVIGHRHPDSDTVSAAMSYAYFLNELGVKAEARVSAKVNNETAYVLDYFGLEAPEIMDDARGKQFVLVDHSAYTHTIDGMTEARIVGVLDHHGIGTVENTEFINVRSAPIGSTATLVYLCFRECEVPIPQEMARIMLMGILSDTKNATSNVTDMDLLAYNDLLEIADAGDIDALYAGMQEAAANYDGMSDMDIYMTDYKEYEVAGVTFGVSDIKANGEEAMIEMCDRMLESLKENYEDIGLDMVFAKVNNISGNEEENQTIMVAYGEGAEELMEESFNNSDGKGHFVFKEYQSRKKAIIPVLTEVLESHSGETEELDEAA